MIADNRIFDVNGESCQELQACLHLVLLLVNRDEFAAFRVDPDQGMVLYVDKRQGSTPFMCGQGSDTTAKGVFKWLQSQPNTEFEGWGSHDGDNERGWRAHMEFWGGVKNDSNATVAIKPHWLWLGK